MIRVTALGGFDAKGPACFLAEIGGARLLLDLGRGPDNDARPALDGVGAVDAVLISHGHNDHVGSLDWLDRIGAPPVHATAPVRRLARDARLQNASDLAPRREIAGVSVETGPAGHAPGAVWMRIGGAAGLVYSGDLCREGGLSANTPLPPARAAILDCSYGAATPSLAPQRDAILAAASAPCLLPVPPDGRGLEIALALSEAGRAIAICDDLRRTAAVLTGCSDWLTQGGPARLQALLDRAAPAAPDMPLDRTIIAAGANCGSGLSRVLGPRALAEGVPIILTGHLSAGSPAAAWVDQGRARRMLWNVHPNRATLADLVAETGADRIMPAFCDAERRADLARALPAPWTQGGILEC